MEQQRALEIVASCGADSLRWPLHERAALLELIRTDPALQARCEAAVPLDAALASWAVQGVAGGSADADAAADAALAAIPGKTRWWGGLAAGGAIAASVVLALAVLPPGQSVMVAPIVTSNPAAPTALPVKSEAGTRTAVPKAAQPNSAAPASDADADAAVYAMMFTETPEEEMSL